MLENSQSMLPVMVLGVLERAINTLVNSDAELVDSLAEYIGKVVRIKSTTPEISFYILFCTDGVQILSQYDGHVDARIRLPLATLVLYLLSPESELDEEALHRTVSMTGNRQLIHGLNRLANQLNIWQLLHQLIMSWLPDAFSLSDLMDALNRADPVWVDKLQALLLSMDGVSDQLKEQTALQRQQLDQLVAIHNLMTLQHLRMQALGLFGLVLVILGVLGANGLLPIVEMVKNIGVENAILMVSGFAMTLIGISYRKKAGYRNTDYRNKAGQVTTQPTEADLSTLNRLREEVEMSQSLKKR